MTRKSSALITDVSDLDLGARTCTATDLGLSDALHVYSSNASFSVSVLTADFNNALPTALQSGEKNTTQLTVIACPTL